MHSSELQFPNAALCVDQLAKEKVVRKYWKFRDHQKIFSAISEILKLPEFLAASLAASSQQMFRLVLFFSAISEISISSVQPSSPQQTEQSTSPPLEKTHQNQSAFQQFSLFQTSQSTFAPSSRQQFSRQSAHPSVQQTPHQSISSNMPQSFQPSIPSTYVATLGIAAPILIFKNFQTAALPFINFTPPQTTTSHVESFSIISESISYTKRMG